MGLYEMTHEKVHGRRLGDEVELFEMEDGKVRFKRVELGKMHERVLTCHFRRPMA